MGDPAPPGPLCSGGEWLRQVSLGIRERAERFYRNQVHDRLNTRMCGSSPARRWSSSRPPTPAGSATARFAPAWPEYQGNGVLASLGNIGENPRAGMLFLDFLQDVIGLHVDGYATVVDDAELRVASPDLASDPLPGRRPECWVTLDVEEAYIHCRKHIPLLAKVRRHRCAWGSDDPRS
jgi:hypothetical protein